MSHKPFLNVFYPMAVNVFYPMADNLKKIHVAMEIFGFFLSEMNLHTISLNWSKFEVNFLFAVSQWWNKDRLFQKTDLTAS